MFFTPEQLGGIVRAILAAAGGYAVSRGLIDESTMATISGAVVTLVVAAWSVLTKPASQE